ncbi:DUF805 domain-containing protein [Streptomyces sp. NPDC003703]|uniref:DUF805 domain-containing protein n=1 Tax=unclassified Streptomyces TaxID=2593676 RepID=UPI00037FF9DB|nr:MULTISPECIES: DUF805 domain-containing protein [unclassified Streptomyces]EYT81711.1 membrane protein [Streptomyces sp. Tu 6176]
MHWYTDVFAKYAVFEGRARRQEYWMFMLINFVIACALTSVETGVGIRPALTGVYSLAVLLPAMAAAVRRLHDTGRTGWWLLIALIPVAGAIVLVIYLADESQPKANAYGPPLADGLTGAEQGATG